MKRFIIIVASLCVMVSIFCIPASAWGTYQHHIIPFTLFSMGDGTEFMYVMNEPFKLGWQPLEGYQMSFYQSNHADGFGWRVDSNSFNDTRITTDITFDSSYGDPDGFSVFISNQSFVMRRTDLLNGHLLWSTDYGLPDNPIKFAITGVAFRMEPQNGLWKAVSYGFDYTSTSTTGTLDICQALYSAMPTKLKQDEFIYFRDLTVSMTTTYGAENEMTTTFTSYGVSPDTHATIATWQNQYNMTQTINGGTGTTAPQFVTWLASAIEGFLNFEMWPGFAFHDLLNVAVVIGILFWFLKLTV